MFLWFKRSLAWGRRPLNQNPNLAVESPSFTEVSVLRILFPNGNKPLYTLNHVPQWKLVLSHIPLIYLVFWTHFFSEIVSSEVYRSFDDPETGRAWRDSVSESRKIQVTEFYNVVDSFMVGCVQCSVAFCVVWSISTQILNQCFLNCCERDTLIHESG